mmetsp:Transcript_5179/g.8521  ORF Transcript_5179/g.8521 Transcript_5179/m.8521 type:complete len:511 (-) Transcript_5179:53-1585(-)|eukprot:CAMPEP_0119019878 /NCGR_PEP_ID=MMETSP1176-20130426/22889_1 /TAXON_ID=265551 /ORGANISM="Synedropsis recta cf, Strain CCMP1620" /LENGTH=510 /DNA_ID=CAMNT_0006974197 /DNA_START=78 /DNA_END=1610 /DNA_ORIENTATION=-
MKLTKSKSRKPIKVNVFSIFLVVLGVGAALVIASMQLLPPPQTNVRDDTGGKDLWEANRNEVMRQESKEILSKSVSSTSTIASNDNNQRKPRYFMVFSTSCSPFQHWQAIAFFHFAKKVNQPGNVTRIVSGCTEAQADELREEHARIIAPLSPSYSLHVTPDFGVKDNTKYWNKPHGLLDWMTNDLGFPANAQEYNDDIIIVLDPDMMLLRPITHEFDNYQTDWVAEEWTNRVVHGTPVAQAYGFGSGWLSSLKGNLSHVVGPDSPALKVTIKEAGKYYPAGPPYLGTGKDMFAIATHWVRFLPRLHEIFPKFMAEMHAYSAAAAHLELPHQLATGFMLSDVGAVHNEAFGFLENVTRKDACLADIPTNNLPFVMHYCQRYALGRWFFSKYKLREDYFQCDAPLMAEPPKNVGEIFDWYMFPNGIEWKDYSPTRKNHFIVLHGWMLCVVVYSLNEVAIELKKKHCNASANFEKTWHFHTDENFQAVLDDPSNPFHDPARMAKLGLVGDDA